MKRLTIPLFILMISACTAQTTDVKYFFSKPVNEEIDKYIKARLESNPGLSFYLTVFRQTQFKEAGNYQVFVGSYENEPTEPVSKLLKASGGRYYLYDESKIPILFDYDFAFVSWGEDEKGRPLRKNVMQHSFFIEFSQRTGKIVRTGS